MPRISTLPLNDRAAAKDELPAVDVAEETTKRITVDMIMPTGAILDYAGTAAPEGWLLCFGQTLNGSTSPQYAELYAAIGNTYGGSSIADFKLPDLRGRVVAGQDDMGGTSANRLTGQSGGVDGDVMGASGGAETHTLTVAQIPPHNHSMRVDNNNAPPSAGASEVSPGPAYAYNRDLWTANTGGGGAHNNVQPTIILNKIIKY